MELTTDGFLGGRLRVLQPRRGYRAGVDPVLLAAAVPARAGETVFELGLGVGVASLCLGARVPGLTLVGIEIQADYADLARQNAEANGVPIEVVTGDLAARPFSDRSFDHVLANPPYFQRGGTAAADPGREAAFGEDTALEIWVDLALRRLRPGGRLTLIQRIEQLPRVLAALGGRAGAITVLPIAGREGRAPERFLLSALKGARTPFRLLAPLVVHSGDHHGSDGESYRPEISAILREGAELRWL